MNGLMALMVPFWAFCAGMFVGIYVPQFLVWYDQRQEDRWAEMRAAIPPSRAYPKRVVEFREAKGE